MPIAMMLETTFVSLFIAKVKRARSDIFIYKIPDTKGTGGKRPFDIIAIADDRTFCLEAKRDDNGTPTPYQAHHLALAFRNGASSGTLNPGNAYYWFEQITGGSYGRGDSGFDSEGGGAIRHNW